jgi:hypothetical protein
LNIIEKKLKTIAGNAKKPKKISSVLGTWTSWTSWTANKKRRKMRKNHTNKAVVKSENGKQDKDLTKYLWLKDEVSAVLKPEEDTRSNKYCVYREYFGNTADAAKLAEISLNTAYGLNYRLGKNSKLRERVTAISNRMPDWYRMKCRFALGPLAEAEMKAVNKYQEEPELLIRHPTLAKHIKQGAGILVGEDLQPVQQQINLVKMQMINRQMVGMAWKKVEDEQITAVEPLEITNGD